MKKVFISLLYVLLSANVYMASANDEQKTPFMTRTFPASSIKDVEVATSGGSITVNGDASSEAVVEVFVSRDKWSNEKIKQTIDEFYTLDIKVENGKLYVTAKPKSGKINSASSLSISFKISVPNQVNSDLQTSGGSIHIGNLSGLQNFNTSGGSLHVENLSGNISGKTSGGSIQVSGSKDIIKLSTSGGSITAEDCSGKITLNTSGGSLKMSNLDGDINAATSGGSIKANNIKGTFTTGTSGGSVNLDRISGNLDARTSGGSMNVEMVSVDGYVKLSNSGNLNLTLPANKGYKMNVRANKIETSNLKDFQGNMDSKSMEGTIGNGGTEIDIKTSQRVNLSFQ